MILTVTVNAALDITYYVPALKPGSVHRVRAVHVRGGGKGLNVARVLAALGEQVVATGLIGGQAGEMITDDLGGSVAQEFLPIAADSRRTVTVVAEADGDMTAFHEPGPQVGQREWARFCAAFEALARDAAVIVLAGSLPPGVPVDAYGQLISRTAAPVLLDADGDALRCGLAAGPALVKVNREEFTGLLGPGSADVTAKPGMLEVPAAVTLGSDGAVVSTAARAWRAVPPARVPGNPTGAGDAFAAALARGMARGARWPDMLADATALSAAAVAAPVAGEFDADAYKRFCRQVKVAEV
jgi:tagatose 6-phosphate kinase